MKKFSSSRLTKGNELFPTVVTIDNDGIYITKPGLFKNKEKFLSFRHIASVNIETPIGWYSTIEIQTTGQQLFKVNGFTLSEVRTMRKLIMQHL